MVRKAATTNIKTKSKSIKTKARANDTKKQARQPTRPFYLLVRKGVPNKKDREATTFLKMGWSKLNWHNAFGFEDHDGASACTAEYFIAHQLVGGCGRNWALGTMDPKVIFNCTRLDTLASGTRVEYWRVSDLPKRLQSNCYWWGGEDRPLGF